MTCDNDMLLAIDYVNISFAVRKHYHVGAVLGWPEDRESLNDSLVFKPFCYISFEDTVCFTFAFQTIWIAFAT